METPRPKAGEGDGARTVSRWVHWQALRGGREYVGRGQLTGDTYRVVLRMGRKRPQWFLITPTPGLGAPFVDADQAMLFADKIEAEAKSVPHGAEKPAAREFALNRNFTWALVFFPTKEDESLVDRDFRRIALLAGHRMQPLPDNPSFRRHLEKKPDLASRRSYWYGPYSAADAEAAHDTASMIYGGAVAFIPIAPVSRAGETHRAAAPADDPDVKAAIRAAAGPGGIAFIPDVMRALMSGKRRMSPGAIRGSLLRLAESGQIELRPEGGIGRLTPEDKQLVMTNARGTVLSGARMIETAGARETPAGAAPLVTLKRNFKQYLECTKLSGVVNRPSAIWKLLGKSLNAEAQEVFVVIPKNIHAKLSDCPVEVARGARDHVEVDPSIVLQAALASNADSFSVVHNHPGSRGDPSQGDIDLTATLEKAAKALDSVKFDEHYIVSAKGVYAIRAKKFWRA